MNFETPSVIDYQWLVEGAGRAWLDQLMEVTDVDVGHQTKRLRQHLDRQQTQILLTQWTLRHRAHDRFRHASRMYFTGKGLEQATDDRLAAYKATRFPTGQPVVDLGCGIGGDLMALAARGPTWGVDEHGPTAFLAQANLELVADHSSRVTQASIETTQAERDTAVHLDPDRRPQGSRTTRLEDHRPGPDVLADWIRRHTHVAIKLAPATLPGHPLLHEAELEWVGHAGECQQLIAWFGDLARHPGRRSATILNNDATVNTWAGVAPAELRAAESVEAFICEPASSLLAAGLAGAYAAKWDLRAITPGGGYLTGPEPRDDDLAHWFAVEAVLSLRIETIRRHLRQHDQTVSEVKKRNVEIDPAQVMRSCRDSGSIPVTLILSRIGKRQIAIVARRQPRRATPTTQRSLPNLADGSS